MHSSVQMSWLLEGKEGVYVAIFHLSTNHK